jgi:hypothetical protein
MIAASLIKFYSMRLITAAQIHIHGHISKPVGGLLQLQPSLSEQQLNDAAYVGAACREGDAASTQLLGEAV